MAGTTRSRRAARLAGVVAVTMTAAALAGTASSAGPAGATVRIGFVCRLPSGATTAVTGLLRAPFAPFVRAGRPLQPGSVDLALTIPRSGVVQGAGAARVAGVAGLTVQAAQGSGVSESTWSGLTGPAVDVPAARSTPGGQGDVVLRLSGRPPVTESPAPGPVLFVARGLTLELTVVQTPAAAAPSGTPSPSPRLSAGAPGTVAPSATVVRTTCVPAAGGPGVIGAVQVVGGRAGAGLRPGTAAGPASKCPPLPKGSLDQRELPTPPPGALILNFPPSPECAYAVGWSNVKKQGEATAVNDPHARPALTSLASIRLVEIPPGGTATPYIELDSLGSLALPPARSTFLSYGLMPTTASLHFEATSPLTIVAVGWGAVFNQPAITTISGYQRIRISDVRINGVPLDVGAHCQTSTPIHMKLHGRADSFLPGGGSGLPDYTVTAGGPLYQKDLYIPPFTGCGTHGENLDALFTAAVSGPGNSLNFVQGPACIPNLTDPTLDYQCDPIGLPDLPTAAPSTPPTGAPTPTPSASPAPQSFLTLSPRARR